MKFVPAGSPGIMVLVLVISIMSASTLLAQEETDNSGEAVALFNQGQDAHEKKDFETAITLYNKALELVPEFPEAELQKGNALLSLNRRDDAEKAFRRAIELREEWTLALSNLGSLLVGSSRFAEAEPFLTKAILLDDTNFPAFAAMAELRLKTNAKPEVIRELLTKMKLLTSKASPTVSIWATRSALERSLGDINSARASAAKALELDPRNEFALSELADAALIESDFTAANEIIKLLESINSQSANVKILRARWMTENGKAADAVILLNGIEKPSAEVLTLRDKIIASTSTDTAQIEKQLETEPKNPALLGRLCSLYRVQDPAKALDYCRRASEEQPQNVSHAIGYGAALVQAKQYAGAAALFRRLLAIAPDNATVRANLATALFQQKLYAEAKVQYQWLTEKQPKLAAAYYFLAITHDQLAEYLDAMANYQLFLKFAEPEKNQLEIEKVNLRLPLLEKLAKDKKGKKKE